MNLPIIFVTRSQAIVEWFGRRGITGPVIPEVNSPAEIANKIVIGYLPLYFAQYALAVITPHIPGSLGKVMNNNLTVEEIESNRVVLTRYIISGSTTHLAAGHYCEKDSLEEFLNGI